MPTINISVARWYGNPKYYGIMPRSVFNALELAFLKGSPVAAVDRGELSIMLSNYAACR